MREQFGLRQSYNSSLDLCHYVTALLQQHLLVLLVVWTHWNDELRTPSAIVITNGFTKIKLCLRIGFCEHYCAQITFFIPGTIGKCSLEREHPLLTEFVLSMNSFFVRYNPPLVEYVNVAHWINSFCEKWRVFCQFQINFIIFEVLTVSVTLHDNIQLVCISLQN